MAAGALRRVHGAKCRARTAATLPARQSLRLPAKQRLDHARSAGGRTADSRWREDQCGIAPPPGGAAVRGRIGRGNRRGRVGLRAHQPPLCPTSKNPRRATGRPAAKRRGGGGWKCSGTPAGNSVRFTTHDSTTTFCCRCNKRLSDAIPAESVPNLLGQVPLEVLDLVVDPKRQKLIPNPTNGGEQMAEEFLRRFSQRTSAK